MTTNRKITYQSTYNNKKILTDKKRGLGCDVSILSKTEELIFSYLKRHNKALVTRIDLRYPKDGIVTYDNQNFSKFTSSMIKNMKRKGLDPYYLAVREQSREKHQHYHMVILVDGNKVQSPHTIVKTAEEHWNRTLGKDKDYKGLVDYCTRSRSGEKQANHYRLRRNDENYDTILNECFQRCSYLAKTNTKGNTPHRNREVFSSRIPK